MQMSPTQARFELPLGAAYKFMYFRRQSGSTEQFSYDDSLQLGILVCFAFHLHLLHSLFRPGHSLEAIAAHKYKIVSAFAST